MASKKKELVATKPKKQVLTPDDDFIRYEYTPSPWTIDAGCDADSKVSLSLSLDAAPASLPRLSCWLLWSAWAAFTTLCALSLVALVIA